MCHLPGTSGLAQAVHPKMVIVAAGLDDFEYRVNQKYAGLVGANTRMWFIENAWHVGGPGVIPDVYSRQMVEFFRTSFEK